MAIDAAHTQPGYSLSAHAYLVEPFRGFFVVFHLHRDVPKLLQCLPIQKTNICPLFKFLPLTRGGMLHRSIPSYSVLF